MIKKLAFVFISLFLLVICTTIIAFVWVRNDNIPERGGLSGESLTLAVLDASVTVKRDRYGVPYIYAQSLADVIRAQGFVTAQDRLTQILVMREAVNGRLAALIGNRGFSNDLVVRSIGINRLAERFAARLESPSLELHDWYLQGLNTYIATQSDEFPLMVRLFGKSPAPLTPQDIVALYLFQTWLLTENWQSELLAQSLTDHLGWEAASQISVLSYNPDDGSEWSSDYPPAPNAPTRKPTGLLTTPTLPGGGSNSWAMSGQRSARGAPILANNPHLDARQLPGIWHPVALITPDWRAVGAAGAGWPGLAVGRSSHIAWGVTNATSDTADLFIEKDDPEREQHYLEGDQSFPYEIVKETIRVRDDIAPDGYRDWPLRVRHTHRGPLINPVIWGFSSKTSDQRMSLRWSVAENLGNQIGIDRLMLAKDVFEAGEAIRDVVGGLNYNVVDTKGNIAHFTAGHVPIRRSGDGSIPLPVLDSHDNWLGFVPFEQAPSSLNPPRGWVGNANHRTVSGSFDGNWSSYSAPSWRYRRMQELFGGTAVLSAEDHWAAITDTLNTFARDIAPVIVGALENNPQTQAAADMLRNWDYRDDSDQPAPALFQMVIRKLVRRIFVDEFDNEDIDGDVPRSFGDLRPNLVERYTWSLYFWQERVHRMLLAGESEWFDVKSTPERENLRDLIRMAARDSWSELQRRLGKDPERWRWGDLSRLKFSNPAQVPGALANRFLGGGDYPGAGSAETLQGAFMTGGTRFDILAIDSLRFVADLGDPDKVLAVIPGGVSGRLFDPHLNDQLPIWLSGDINYWWFSDEAISANTQRELILQP